MNKPITSGIITDFGWLSLAVLVLLQAGPAVATEYVPPPTGPYQSTVVIKSENVNQQDSSSQIYKFPSDDLIPRHKPSPSTVPNEQELSGFPADSRQAYQPGQQNQQINQQQGRQPGFQQSGEVAQDYFPTRAAPEQRSAPVAQSFETARPAGQDQFRQVPANPWAVDMQRKPSPYPNNVWGNQSYGAQQYNPYGYQSQSPYPYQGVSPNQNQNSNPNSFMNSPFNSMPSPWTTMPMQPFFSGR